MQDWTEWFVVNGGYKMFEKMDELVHHYEELGMRLNIPR